MTLAVVLAGFAGALVVPAAHDALAAAEALRLPAAARRLLLPLGVMRRLGSTPSTRERRRLVAVAAATVLIGGWLLAGPVAGVALAAAAPATVAAAIRARRRRYLADLGDGAPAGARALADALAGGHSIRGALAAAGTGVTGAAGTELRAAGAALEAGERTEAVLERLRRRARSAAWDTIVAAILLNRDAGGDLARLLRGTAGALEDAARLEREARSVTAQARFTALVVAALPAGAALLAELAAPGYLAGLAASPLTLWLGGSAVVLQAAALLLVRRLGRVRG